VASVATGDAHVHPSGEGVNFPAAIAEAVKIEKGETMEWFIEDRNTFILKRMKPCKYFLKKP